MRACIAACIFVALFFFAHKQRAKQQNSSKRTYSHIQSFPNCRPSPSLLSLVLRHTSRSHAETSLCRPTPQRTPEKFKAAKFDVHRPENIVFDADAMQAHGRPFDLSTGGMPSSLCKREIIGHQQDVVVADLQRELRNLRDRSKETLAKSMAEMERLTQENSALKEKNAQLEDKIASMSKHIEQPRRFSLFSSVSQSDLNKSEWTNRLESLEREKDREIGMLNCKLRGRDTAIENLEQMVEQQAQSIRSLQSDQDEFQPRINELEAANVDKALIIEQQNTKVRDHSVTISTLIQTVKSQNQAMANLRSENERMKSEAVGSIPEQKLDASCEKVLLYNVQKVEMPKRRSSNASYGTASSSSSVISDSSGCLTVSERAASMTISERTSSIAPSERVASLTTASTA